MEGLTSDREHWCRFLRTAAYQYKYPFADQVLIYAQKPGATACAELEIWNRYFNRRVKRGARGIALMREKNGHLFLDHVFDVSDTYSRAGENLKLWSVREEYTDELVTMLGNRYGDVNKRSLIDAVVSAAYIAAEDNLPDYKEELLRSAEGSFLDVYDDDSLRFRLQEVLQASVAYTVLTRLGYKAEHYIDSDAFDYAHEFSTPATVSVLGAANGDISEIILRDIERTAKACEKKLQEQNRTFDGISEIGYNEGEERNTKENGGFHYDDQLHDEGRGTVPESDNAGADRAKLRQVRNVTPDLSERTPQGDVFPDDGERNTDRAPLGDRADGESTDRGEYISDGTEPWSDRADESRESNEMGSNDEQYPEHSGGGSVEQSDLSVDRSVDRLIDQSNAAIGDKTLPNIADMQTLIQILRHGDYLRKSKGEIVSFLSSDATEEQKIRFVKEAFPPLQFSEFFKPGTQQYLGYRADNHGLMIYEGNFQTRTAESVMTWSLVTDLIGALIKDKNYLDEPIAVKQLSALDVPEIQAEMPHPAVIEKVPDQPKTQQNFAVSQEVIDAFLRLGGCTSKSNYRIYGFYRRANNPEENIKYLRAEYEADAVGLIVNGQKAAVSWDEDGVTFAQGENVADAWRKTTFSWADIDKRIRQLIELGQYLPQDEVKKAIEAYDHDVADRAASRWWDGYREADIPYISKDLHGYHDVVYAFEEVLKDNDKIRIVADAFAEAANKYTDRHRYRYGYGSEFVSKLLQTYKRDPVDYPQTGYVMAPEHFVSGDKIDNYLIDRGSGISEGKFRIYSFFLRNKDNAERAKFLSGEYGIGGMGSSRYDTKHDGKGLAIAGGLDKLGQRNILLTWVQVVKRIDELIRKDRYLTTEEIGYLDTYEKEQIARDIYSFYNSKDKSVVRPFPYTQGEYYDGKAIDAITAQLDDKERVNEILTEMQMVFDSAIPGNRYYDSDKKQLSAVRSFAEGTYNLFPNSKFRRKEPVRKEETIASPVEEKQTADVDLAQYGLHITLGAWLYIGKEEVQLSSVTEDGVALYNGTLFPMELPLDVFVRRVKENPLNEHLTVKDEPSQTKDTASGKTADEPLKLSEDVHIYVDTDREELIWIYYNPDSTSGGQFVTNSLAFQVFKEAYDDFLENNGEWSDKDARDKFINSISEMANQSFTNRNIPFFIEAQVDYEETPDYVDFTPENIQNIVRKIEDYIIDSDSERSINEHEAEFGADGYRVFPGNRPKQGIPESLSIWQRYKHVKQEYPDYLAMMLVLDSYEFYGDDAKVLSEVAELPLTSREIMGIGEVPMCNFRFHQTDNYLQKLLDAGYPVVISDSASMIPVKATAKKEQSRTDDEIARILPDKGSDILRLYENRFSDDRFYVDQENGEVTWIYFNPDSTSKGQFIENIVTFEQIAELKDNMDYTVFFDKLGSEAKQYIVDSDDKNFKKTARRFLTDEYTFRGFGSAAREILISVAEEKEKADMKESPNRFSIRLMPYEGGRIAIWDASIKKYLGENTRQLLFADQNDAIRHLAYLQHKHGIPEVAIFTTDKGKAYHVGDTLFTSFENNNDRVHMEITRVDECYVWYTMPSEPGQNVVNMDRAIFEKYLDTGNITVVADDVILKRTDDVTESVPVENVVEFERAKAYIREYLIREFDEREDHFEDLNKIILAYTTVGDEDIPVQAEVDLVEYTLKKYLGDILVETNSFDSLEEMNDNLLCGLDFGELTEVTDDQIALYHRETDIPQFTEEVKQRKTLPMYNSHSEIPDSEKHNYRIIDDEIGMGGAKEKFRKNIAAINLLHELEFDNRLATPEEQEILAQYSSWGGLADAFDETKDNWSKEFTELYTTLSPEEYRAAEESTLTAFYTPPVVIKAMYKALENMGFQRGNVLEPSCGVGNFMGLVPKNMDAKMYGVELDSLSGRIARQLYQKNGITISGYEKTEFPDSFFDVAIGNVPFNDFKLLDKRYDKYNFLIHDYFFAKTLDKVRPGGVIAFITSSGTLDKQNPAVRKYIAQRADFLGAIRLPNNTFNGAGAEKVVSDIIFLQKRDRIIEADPDWIHLGKDENGIPLNQYFVDHPDMVLGEMVMRSGPYGPEPTCKAYEDQDLGELLSEAITNIHAEIAESEIEELTGEEAARSIPADPSVKNFSFTLVDGKVYYRQNSVMNPVQTSVTGENRIKGMIAIRDTVRELIEAQLENVSDNEIKNLQAKLNLLYDNFTYKYGLINSRANASVFSDDNSYFLLCSLEILDENKQLKAKADMFTKRTIKPQITVDRVDTASEALAVSIGERAGVDMEYMSELTGKSEDEIYDELKGVIFLNPLESTIMNQPKYLTADEYLSGNVREKLARARSMVASDFPEYTVNVEALEKVQPVDLTAAEIGVKLGSTWIPEEDIKAFIMELLTPSYYIGRSMDVKYIGLTGQWVITEKNYDSGNVKANSTYGTHRINAYHIIEETLNLKDVRVMDYVEDRDGNKKAVLNKKETMIAQGKQEQIKRAFDEWIWKDPERRERLCKLYNERFNSIRPREYDGSHIRFDGMNPEITLRQHQKNAVARSLYGGNALYAHVVGAGKTFTMVAAAQEGKRLGLCSKSMFVVPNHLIEQWASEYLQLYPSANILVTTKKDFETKNRKKFCARIATGDYDAIIIGHSQFEKIPVSVVRQMRILQNEIDTITVSVGKLKYDRGDRVTVKQFQKMKKRLEAKLEKLNDQSRKDDVVCFEELGVDRLFVDESHFYKNLFAYTKMRNVAGIAQTEAQKSSDLFMKCRYLDELTGGRGITFATGTPISNTMVELYTIQRYLQFDELNARGLSSFDAWASTFGETVTAIELAPDGTGYRTKTRFAKFFNIPELMAMFKQVADVQTADMLNLPVPKANFHVIKTAPSEIQKELVQSFSERAERIHNGMVTAQEDNMLLVTNDGRKAALDQRLIDPMLPDFEGSKVNACVQNVYDIWEQNTDKKSAQLVFCDLSTPKNDGTFNVYDDIKAKLILRGIPPEEIAFIHSADTDVKKQELFAKVREGQVRVLLGSTFKMGAGTNVQKRLKALHDLDVPWRPSDLEQRSGRIIRQGNSNPEVDISRYVTEGTFDAYCYQLLESKQKFISQIMTSKSPVRVAEDVDETALSYAEIKALASGNPLIMEKMQLDNDVAKLKLQKADYLNQRYALEDKILKQFPKDIAEIEERIAGYTADLQTVREHTLQEKDGEKVFSPMVIMDNVYTERADAGKAILEICKKITTPDPRPLGEYRGLKTEIGFDTNGREFFIDLKGKMTYRVSLGQDAGGIITRLDNALNGMEKQIGNCEEQLTELHKQMKNAKAEIAKPFPDESVLEEKCKRLDELNSELNLDKKENEIVEDAENQGEEYYEINSNVRDERYDR